MSLQMFFFFYVGEALSPSGWLLYSCSEQQANHNKVGCSLWGMPNYGYIARPVCQKCKMAVLWFFSSGHTTYCRARKHARPRDHNTKKKTNKQKRIPVKWLVSSHWSKSWWFSRLFLLPARHHVSDRGIIGNWPSGHSDMGSKQKPQTF